MELKTDEKPQAPPQLRPTPRRRRYQDPETRRFATLYVLDRIYGEARGSILLKLGSKLPAETQHLLADHLDRNILSLRPLEYPMDFPEGFSQIDSSYLRANPGVLP